MVVGVLGMFVGVVGVMCRDVYGCVRLYEDM